MEQQRLFEASSAKGRSARGSGIPKGATGRRGRAAVYEAGSSTRRTLGWLAPTVSPNQILESLTVLRDRSRLATRNDGFAKGIIDRLVHNIVGTGLKPLSQADDPEFRRAAQALWLRWTDESDADGILDWYGQQSQAVRCWMEAGEVFVRLRARRPEDGLSVPLQVQVLEPEMCPHTHNTVASGGNKIRAGIEFDRLGRRIAYYFFASRPGDLMDWDPGDLRRVSADQVLHIYKPMRPGQLRGLPHLTQALVRLRELDKFDDATLLRQQLANMFVAFLKHPATDSSSVVPIMGQEPTDTEGDRPVLGLKPGIFQELEPGEEVEFSKPPDVITGYGDFIKGQLRAACSATGVPYEVLTGNFEAVNDRTARVVLHEFRRYIQAEQHQTVAFQLCQPVWDAWMVRALVSGGLPVQAAAFAADPARWSRVKWMPQGWPYIHPVQDVQAQQGAIRCGFTSRSEAVSQQGEDAEVVDAQQAADNERADALGLKYDSDARSPGSKPDPGPDGNFGEAPANAPGGKAA